MVGREPPCRVTVHVAFEPARVFLGETAQVRVRIENRRRLPVPIVRVSLPLPEGLLAEADPAPTAFRGHRLRLSLDARSEATFALPVFPRERGEFWLDTVTVDLSDPFDLAPVRREVQVPTTAAGDAEGAGRGRRRGGTRAAVRPPRAGARLFEDREHFAGVRDYEPGRSDAPGALAGLGTRRNVADQAVRTHAFGRGPARDRPVHGRALLARGRRDSPKRRSRGRPPSRCGRSTRDGARAWWPTPTSGGAADRCGSGPRPRSDTKPPCSRRWLGCRASPPPTSPPSCGNWAAA